MHITPSNNKSSMARPNYRKLFIGGLDPSVDESELLQYFEKYGAIEDCVVLRDTNSGRHRRCGFVSFQNKEIVDVVQADRPHKLRNKEVQLKRAVPKEQFQELDGHLTVNKLFVGGINDQIKSEDLRTYFSQFGLVQRVKIFQNYQTGRCRGFAFVEFFDYDPVDKVVLTSPHKVRGKTLNVRKAMTKFEISLLRERDREDKKYRWKENIFNWQWPFGLAKNGYFADQPHFPPFGFSEFERQLLASNLRASF